jgi:hypothetical protein
MFPLPGLAELLPQTLISRGLFVILALQSHHLRLEYRVLGVEGLQLDNLIKIWSKLNNYCLSEHRVASIIFQDSGHILKSAAPRHVLAPVCLRRLVHGLCQRQAP